MEPLIVVPEPPEERPRSVTIVGGTFLVLSLWRVLLDVVSWIVWKVGNPEPLISFLLPRDSRQFAPVDWVLRRASTLIALQALVALGVAWVSYSFLRLRAWARPTLEIVCWLAMAAILAFTGTLLWLRARFATLPDTPRLLVGIAVLVLLEAAFGAAVWTIRSPSVRAAFERSRSSGARSGGTP